jgi:hypothetical protein
MVFRNASAGAAVFSVYGEARGTEGQSRNAKIQSRPFDSRCGWWARHATTYHQRAT